MSSDSEERNEPIAFHDYYIVASTDLALLVRAEDAADTSAVWIPRSQTEVTRGHAERKSTISFEIPRWLAEAKDMA